MTEAVAIHGNGGLAAPNGRVLLDMVMGEMRGAAPFRYEAEHAAAEVTAFGEGPRRRWSIAVEQEQPGRAVGTVTFLEGFGPEEARSFRVLMRDGSAWSDSGNGWEPLAPSQAEYFASLPRLYSAFDDAVAFAPVAEGAGARVSGLFGRNFTIGMAHAADIGEGVPLGTLDIHDASFLVAAEGGGPRIGIRFQAELVAQTEMGPVPMGHEWQCVDVRARDFGSDIVVPEAPALTPEGAQGRTIKDVAAYLLSPEVEGDELEAEDLPTEAEAAVPPWVLGLREAEGPDLGVVD